MDDCYMWQLGFATNVTETVEIKSKTYKSFILMSIHKHKRCIFSKSFSKIQKKLKFK